MINLENNNHWRNLQKIENDSFDKSVNSFLTDKERLVRVYQCLCDDIAFTNKRIIIINFQKTGRTNKHFTSIPYSKINMFSLETTGTFHYTAELEIHLSSDVKLSFEFNDDGDVREIYKMISNGSLE